MIRRVLKMVKKAIQDPKLLVYRYLMSPANEFKGRILFGAEELKLLHEALLTQNLFGIDGKMVTKFEKDFGLLYSVPYAVASTSGTAAIHTALGALDLNPGDEIITAPITDLGTIIPILYQQAIPVFADIDATCNMDPDDVERKITSKTKAILVVHLFGNPCDMDRMVQVARKHKIPLIEDCSQAHMTSYKGKFVGTIGDIGCFSFQQSKHMTTGDGGMTITSNKEYYERMKLFVDKGYARKGWGARSYLFLAPNYRMNELTAAVGIAQLVKVKKVIEQRREISKYFTELLKDVSEVTPLPITIGANPSYWLYAFTLKGVDVGNFANEIKKEKISISVGYTGKPIYLCSESLASKKTFGDSQFPFSPKVTDKKYEYKEGLCPKAETALENLICIPFHEHWSKRKVEQAVNAVKKSIGALSKKDASLNVEEKPVTVSNVEVKEKLIKIGVIGCGAMGKWHTDCYKNNPKVKLMAFVDLDLEKAQKLAQPVNGKVFVTHQEMLKSEKLDGVSICTVPVTHKKIVLDLLDAGVNVLCEKPLAISVEEAKEMIQKANQKDKLLLTAFKFRFMEEVQQAKELLDKKSFGRILNFRLMFGGFIDMTGAWYGKKHLSGGGIIMDNGPHAFDLTRYLFGEVVSTYADLGYYQGLEVEDTAQISCVLENGARGVIDLSWSSSIPSKTYLEVYGEDGAMLLDFQGISYKFKTWDDWKRIDNQKTVKQAFAVQIDHFVDAIEGNRPLKVTNDDGLKTQMVIESTYKSVQSVHPAVEART